VGTRKIVGSMFTALSSLMIKFLSHSDEVIPSWAAVCAIMPFISGVSLVQSRSDLTPDFVLGMIILS